MASPLADKLRPRTLEDVVGQSHLLAQGQVLRSIIEGGTIPNMIFYGPSGVGKTTVANIIANKAGKKLYRAQRYHSFHGRHQGDRQPAGYL